MFISQKRVIPRCKEWLPLATHQVRIRSLIKIIGLNLGTRDGKTLGRKTDDGLRQTVGVSYYYTLHVTAMSAPFYTSERLSESCPKWKEVSPSLWASADVFGGLQCFVIRLWIHNSQEDCDEVLKVFGIYLSGLVYLGPHLRAVTLPATSNSLLFLLPGGYYTVRDNSDVTGGLITPKSTSISVTKNQIRKSFSRTDVNRLCAVQRAIRDKQAETDVIKQKILTGDFMTSDRKGSAALRKIMNQHKPKSNLAHVNRLKEELECARFRVELLEHEKRRMTSLLSADQARLEVLSDSNQMKESRTMEGYRVLLRSVQKHKKWLEQHVQRREKQLHERALLSYRIKELITGINMIYPVEKVGNKYTICGVHLPDADHLHTINDTQASAAVSFIAHVVVLVSFFLQVPLRYPVEHRGSFSVVTDLITEKFPDGGPVFPLFMLGQNKDRARFSYGVYLINKNIAGLRWLCNLTTSDLRSTLPNLYGLLHLLDPVTAPSPRAPLSPTNDPTPTVSVSSPIRAVPRTKLPSSAAPSPNVAENCLNSYSYSLDKGLNEIERRRLVSLGDSESRLCLAEDAATCKYLQNWHVYKSGKHSDDECDETHGGVFVDKTVSSIEAIEGTSGRRVSIGQEVFDDSFLVPIMTDLSAEMSRTTVILAELSAELERTTEMLVSGDESLTGEHACGEREKPGLARGALDTVLSSENANIQTNVPEILKINSGNESGKACSAMNSHSADLAGNSMSLLNNANMKLEKSETARNMSQENKNISEKSTGNYEVGLESSEPYSAHSRKSVLSGYSPKKIVLESIVNDCQLRDGHSDDTPDVVVEANKGIESSVVADKVVAESSKVALEDDVAHRAEALASNTTSFNMFRSRFRSSSVQGTTES